MNENRGKSEQIDLAIYEGKILTIMFLKNRDRSHRRGPSIFVVAWHVFSFNLRYRGGGGGILYPTKPLSNNSNILKFITIFVNL